jgi:exonuclease SbcD
MPLLEDQRYTLDRLLELVRDAKPDFLLISGDIYDRAIPPVEAVELLDDTLTTLLKEFRLPTVLIAGNHDSGRRLSFGSRLMRQEGLHVVSRLSEALDPIHLPGIEAEIFGIPFAEPSEVRAMLDRPGLVEQEDAMAALLDLLPVRTSAGPRIIMAHAYVEGGRPCESERAITTIGGTGRIAAGLFQGFDYTALGHLHEPQYVGEQRIRYSGSLCRYSFSEERQAKSCTMVEFRRGKPRFEEIPLPQRRGMRTVEGSLEVLLALAQKEVHSDDMLRVRFTDKLLPPGARDRLLPYWPNILEIARPEFERVATGTVRAGDLRRASPIDHFRNFYQECCEKTLSFEKEQIVREVFAEVAPELQQ